MHIEIINSWERTFWYMKWVLFILGIFFLICTASVSAESLPDISGKWIIINETYLKYSGEIVGMSSGPEFWNLTQDGRIVTGENTFYSVDRLVTEKIAGIISTDGKTVNFVDKSGGTYIGTLEKDGTMSVTYLNTGDLREDSGYAFVLWSVMKKENT